MPHCESVFQKLRAGMICVRSLQRAEYFFPGALSSHEKKSGGIVYRALMLLHSLHGSNSEDADAVEFENSSGKMSGLSRVAAQLQHAHCLGFSASSDSSEEIFSRSVGRFKKCIAKEHGDLDLRKIFFPWALCGENKVQRCLVDESVYSRNRCFRILHSSKFGKRQSLEVRSPLV